MKSQINQHETIGYGMAVVVLMYAFTGMRQKLKVLNRESEFKKFARFWTY